MTEAPVRLTTWLGIMRIVVTGTAVGAIIGLVLWRDLWMMIQVCLLIDVGLSVIFWFAVALWERRST
jgi:hypothetical protein